MMTYDETDSAELDALYAAWREDRDGQTPTSLQQWMVRESAHSEELVDWTADAALLDCANALPADPTLVERTVAIGKRTLAAYQTRRAASAEPPLASLKETAGKRGLTLKALANGLDLGLPIVAKLEQRLLRLESIPARLIDRLADSLQVSAKQVRAYLAQPPALSSAALYRADAAPRTGSQEEFAQAIQTCAGMTDSQKQAWLSDTHD
jgi:hypothetical protein